MCLLLKVKTIKAWILSWYTTLHSLIICSKTIYQTGTFCFMLSRRVSSILLGLRQRMEREHFPAFFCLIFQRKLLKKKHHLTREVMKTTPFPILLGLLLASGLCMVWTNMVLKIRSPTLKTYKMKILSVRPSLTGIFKTTITFFSLTSK